ncbi:YciI family protein [Kribbella sp. NBC_01245]|uniref:YciI family protein n=1 Tax=Kribbella sp. NBC_01245 TaxID=2903578 RepID=UPI002E2B834B|nr:YciI family protein [Kribbella sp. NBC_01245]
MEYFVYGRDLPGTAELKAKLTEEHWAFMDGYGEQLIARGPTLTGQDDDAESTGSMHIVGLPDVEAARAFAFEEPYYKGGVFESVQLYRFHNTLGRTMWDFTDAVDNYGRYLLLTLDESTPAPTPSKHLIVYGDLLAIDTDVRLGRAVLAEAPDRETAATLLPAGANTPTEVHHWSFGGRR